MLRIFITLVWRLQLTSLFTFLMVGKLSLFSFWSSDQEQSKMPIILSLTRLALEPSRATAVSMAVPFGRKLQELSGSTERERGEREKYIR